MQKNLKQSTVNRAEVEQFERAAEEWWDESGAFQPLHRLNPVRLRYLKEQVCKHFGLEPENPAPFKKLRMVDIGCGGGLVTEPLCRMGAQVTGVDAGEANLRTARAHAKAHGLAIDYRCTTAEALAETGETFDVVTALEIIEHVDNPEVFIAACSRLLKKNGVLILSTLNRTPKSFLLGIAAAEYILRWVPRGTHQWKKFIKPSEVAHLLGKHNMRPVDVTGIVYRPGTQQFALDKNDLEVNYLLSAVHPIK